MTLTTTFAGFPPHGIDLLSRLPDFDTDEFRDHADAYRTGIAEPSKAFVRALGPELATAVSDGITFEPRTNRSIAPINNDRRFNPGVAVYKDHLLFRFWEGPTRARSSTLFVRITPSNVGFGVGAVFTSDQIEAFRSAVDEDGDRIARAIAWLVRHRGAEVLGSELKRVPAPYAAEHPHADLLRFKRLQIRWSVDPDGALGSRRLVTACRNQLVRAAEVHRWLVDHLA